MERNSGKIGAEAWLGLTGAVQKRVIADPAAPLAFITSQSETVRRGLKSAFDSVMLSLATAFATEGDWKMSDLQPWIARVAGLPAESRPGAAGNLASRMAATDPQAAVTWVSSLTDDSQRLSAIGSLTSRWAGSDSYEASQ